MRFRLIDVHTRSVLAARRQDVEGVAREPDIFAQLDQYVGKSPGGGLPYFMHLSHTTKIGVNPKQHYLSTPLGVYFYPITSEMIDKVRSSGMYRMDANMNLFVVQARNPEKVLVLHKESGYKLSPETFLYEKLKAQAIARVSPEQKDAYEYEKSYNEYSARELRSRPSFVHNYDKSDFEPASALVRGLLSIEERLTRRTNSHKSGVEDFLLEWLTFPDSVGFPVTYGLNIRVQTPNGEGVVQDSYYNYGERLYEVVFSNGETQTYERGQLKSVPMTVREWVSAVKSIVGKPFSDERAFLDAPPEEQNQALVARASGKYEMRRIEHKIERRPPNRNIVEFATALLRAGYEGVYDPGLGIIHKNEPEQAVFFGSRYFDVVAQLTTPNSKSLARKTPDEKSLALIALKYQPKMAKAETMAEQFSLAASMLKEVTPFLAVAGVLPERHAIALAMAERIAQWYAHNPAIKGRKVTAFQERELLKLINDHLVALTHCVNRLRLETKTDFPKFSSAYYNVYSTVNTPNTALRAWLIESFADSL